MKGIEIRESGGPEVLVYKDLPDPVPGPDEVLIDVRAIGVNYSDVLLRLGRYPLPLPVIPGLEAAGVIVDVGGDVTGLSKGDLVAYVGVPTEPRAYAERIAAPVDRVLRLPENVEPETAAAVVLQGMAAHYLVHDTYRLGPGHTAVVHAGAGGVGLLLTQMAKMLGACVIACVSTEAKASVAKAAGADFVLLYGSNDFRQEVMDITGGAGADVVYDSVGARTFEASLACLARRGYLVLFGQASGPVAHVPTALLAARSLYLTRPQLADYTASREELTERATEVLTWVASGKLHPRIHKKWALSDAPDAHRQLEGRLTSGKLLLCP